MFLNEEAYKKNSLFGTFEKQIKRSQFTQQKDADSSSTFQVISYLKFSENDVAWYHDLTDKLIEKEQKLKSWKNTNQPPRSRLGSSFSQHSHEDEAMEVERPASLVVAEEKEEPQSFVYAPRSPSPPPSTSAPREAEKKESKRPEVMVKDTSPVVRQPSVSNPARKQLDMSSKSPATPVVQEPADPPRGGSRENRLDPPLDPPESHVNYPGQPRPAPPARGPRPAQEIPYPWHRNKKACNLMKNWYPLAFKLAFPFASQLNSAEQKDYIDLYKQFTAIQREHQGQQTIQLEGKMARLYKKYAHFKNLLSKEYVNFEKFAKAYYRRAVFDDYSKLDANVERYMKELLAFLHEHIKASYEPLYRQIDVFSLAERSIRSQAVPEPNANLKFETHLVRLGTVNKIIFPNVTMDRQAPVTLSYSEVSRRTSIYDHVVAQDGAAKRTDKVYFVKPPLHSDPNAERLALKYKANVVMSNSSFVNLMFELSAASDSTKAPFDYKVYNEQEEYAHEQFQAPLIVKVLKAPDGKESPHRCLFFEKPLVPTHLSKREVNEKYYKRALLATFIKTVSLQQNKEAVLALRKAQHVSAAPEAASESKEDNYVDHDLLSNLEASIEKGKAPGIPLVLAHEPALPSVPELKEPAHEVSASQDSSDSEVEAKKLKIDVDEEDYQFYDDSDAEDRKLMIVDATSSANPAPAKSEEAAEDLETPASPPGEAAMPVTEIGSPERQPAPKVEEQSAAAGHYNLRSNRKAASFEEPKVIPLEKVDPPDAAAVEPKPEEKATKPSTSAGKEETAAQPSLFELIYKMQEKLTSAQASVMQDAHSTEVPAFHHQPAARTPFNYVNKTQLNEMAENPKEYSYVPNKHENVSYSLWTLNTSPPIRILVRSSSDGYINDETSSHNKVVVYPKLEYQPQFGCERLSKRDYCRMWCKSFLRLGCNVVLCRINVFMNKIGSISNLKNQDLLPQDCSFNPQQALNQMRDLFKKCLNLKENSYLLAKSDMKSFHILESVSPERHPNFDLCRHYSYPSRWDKNPLWLPIDPALYLPYHYHLGRVPGTFEPEEVRFPAGQQSSDLGGGPGKKKRKRSNAPGKGRKNL